MSAAPRKPEHPAIVELDPAAEPALEDADAHEEDPPEEEDEFVDGDDDEDVDDYFDLAQLAQLLVTEDGEPVADVLRGVRDALDKQNKILFKLASAADKIAARA